MKPSLFFYSYSENDVLLTSVFFCLVPSAPPANISVFVSDRSNIQVTWSRVPGHSVNGIITGYLVKVFNSHRHLVTQFSTDNTTFYVEVKNLKSYGNFCIEVAAFNRKGQGPLSNDFCVVTDDGGEYMMTIPCLVYCTKSVKIRNVRLRLHT